MAFWRTVGEVIVEGLYKAFNRKARATASPPLAPDSELEEHLEIPGRTQRIIGGEDERGGLIADQLRQQLSLSDSILTERRNRKFRGQAWGIAIDIDSTTGALVYRWGIHKDYRHDHELVIYRAEGDCFPVEDIWNTAGMRLILQSTRNDSIDHVVEFGHSYIHVGMLKSLHPTWLDRLDNAHDPVRFTVRMPSQIEFERFKKEVRELESLTTPVQEKPQKSDFEEMMERAKKEFEKTSNGQQVGLAVTGWGEDLKKGARERGLAGKQLKFEEQRIDQLVAAVIRKLGL